MKKSINLPTSVYSVALNPEESEFVCGGEDFVIRNYDFEDFTELGMNGHVSVEVTKSTLD